MSQSVLIIFVVLFAGALSEGYYQVVGPRVIRPNSVYYCAISIQATSEPTRVLVKINGTSYKGNTFNVAEQVEVQPYSSKISKLLIGDLEDGAYTLIVEGIGGLDFQSEFALDYLEKTFSVFVQTDRAVYQPGSKILFRAIVLNPQLKPAAEVRNELLHIHVSDGEGNRVKEWRNVDAIRGIFTGEVQLDDSPVLGNWNISVTIHKQTYSKTVEVAQYIMPKFKVDIQAPKHVTFRDNTIIANINTKYNYGKKVKGEATVTAYPTIYSGVIQPIFQNPIRKVLPIDGSATVQFDIAKDLELSDEYERIVIIDVTVEESLTGRRQNNSVVVHIHKYDYRMDLIKSADYFKPGLKYTAYVKVVNHDGTALPPNQEITVRHGYSRVDEVYLENQHKLDKNGEVKLEYYTPRNVSNTTALRIQAEYKDLKERISPIPAAVSLSDNFMQVTLWKPNKKPRIHEPLGVLVNCTEPMRYINYVLLGSGQALNANTFRVNNSKVFLFNFTVNNPVAPVVHLIVSYIRSDGELVGDALDIEMEEKLPNFIDIEVSTSDTAPSKEVDLTISAKPNSYIGLMAVDKTVSMLRGGYDLSHEQVTEEMQRYDLALGSPYKFVTKNSEMPFMWNPGSSNPHSAVYESGADLRTNAHILRLKPTLEDIYLRPVFYGTSTVKPDRGFGLAIHSVTRPPLAGPYAFSRIPRPVWNKPKVYLTEDIAPTWLFHSVSSEYDGKASFRRLVPATLNTWLITGFSLDPLHGLGLITTPQEIKVTENLVVTLDLPYSIQRGEILAVPVVVYNHLNVDVKVEITLLNLNQQFEFAEVSNEVNGTKKVELFRSKKITIKKNAGSSVSFMITPRVHGFIEIKATATTSTSQNSAVKNLRVILEGETEYYTKSLLIDLRKTTSFKGNISFTLPKNFVQNSLRVEASVLGDLFGAVIVNLDHLIRLPTGCGEQNLVHFLPSLLILQHLKHLKQVNTKIVSDAINNMETSYQQQLSYKRADGSFSPFGSRDPTGNVWLTANVALSIKYAKAYIYIDENVVNDALNWLLEHQQTDGSFVETGNIIHEPMQSRNGNNLALTAYVLMAFQEKQRGVPVAERNRYNNYTNAINKGLDYIARNMAEEDSVYTLAICSYTLHLSNNTSKQSAFNLLDAKAKTQGNMKWWGRDIPANEEKNPWNHLPRSIDIETTSYALLTFIKAGLLEDAIPVVNWLLNQQNSLGGFSSSQDTILGLHALFSVIHKLSTPTTTMQVELAHGKQETNSFNINSNNAMIVQKKEIVGKDVRNVNVSASGSGLALLQLAYQYNMNVTGPWPMFTLDPQVDKNSNRDHLQVSICTAFVSRNLTDNPISNMAVMEVTLPSGFTADIDSLPSLEVSQNVQKVETSHDLTKIILYFNNISRIEFCPTISAFRTHKVAKQKPVSVVIYDYYDSSRRARVFYRGPRATLCDICENEDCGDICSLEAETGSQTAGESKERDGSGGGASMIIASTVLVILINIVMLVV